MVRIYDVASSKVSDCATLKSGKLIIEASLAPD